jgi:hypothetical protein
MKPTRRLSFSLHSRILDLPSSSHFLMRPQLLTRSSPFPLGRDIPQVP